MLMVLSDHVGAIIDLQVPMLVIDRRGVSIMSTLFMNHRVTHLSSSTLLNGYGTLEKSLDNIGTVSRQWKITNKIKQQTRKKSDALP
jgi:hypothetical protein